MWIVDGVEFKTKPLGVIWQWFGVVAMVRWGKIYATTDFPDKIKKHELTHIPQQTKQHKWIIFSYPIFLFKYIYWWFKKGYENNPFEL